jgi:hypothetical protein
LSIRFNSLFELSINNISVAEMCWLGWVEEGGWRWRRRLFAWEEESLHSVVLCWKMCYYMLMFQIDGRDNLILMMGTRLEVLMICSLALYMLLQHIMILFGIVPFKLFVFTWRMLQDKLSTKTI